MSLGFQPHIRFCDLVWESKGSQWQKNRVSLAARQSPETIFSGRPSDKETCCFHTVVGLYFLNSRTDDCVSQSCSIHGEKGIFIVLKSAETQSMPWHNDCWRAEK